MMTNITLTILVVSALILVSDLIYLIHIAISETKGTSKVSFNDDFQIAIIIFIIALTITVITLLTFIILTLI